MLVRRVAHVYEDGKASTAFMVPAFSHHLRPRLDSIRLLLVSIVLASLLDLTFSAIMKIYALFTLHETGWGTRSGIGDRKLILFAPYTINNTLTISCYRLGCY